MSIQSIERRIGLIVGSPAEIPIAQEFAATFCDKFNLSEKYKYDLQLVIEEFLMSLFDGLDEPQEVSFYFSFQEKAIRLIFDIASTSFQPVIAEFSPMEFEADEETHSFIGLTVIKRMVDTIKHIKEGDTNEVHFIMYITDEDFRDIHGFHRRYPIFKKDEVIISETKRGDKTGYNLRLKDRDNIFAISEKEYFIMNMLDGQHELTDLVQKFSEKYGPISPRSINRFIDTLEEQKFIEAELDIAFGEEYQEEEVTISLLEKILSLEYSFPHVDKMVTAVYKNFKWLLSKPFAILIILSVGLLAYEIFFSGGAVFYYAANALKRNLSNPWLIVFYYLVMLFTVSVHEFAHAVTCKKYGGQVNKMGVMLYYFQVAAFADTSDAWLFKEKYKRILTSLNGPGFSVFLASCFLWIFYMLTPVVEGSESFIHPWLWRAGSYLNLGDIVPPGIGNILLMAMVANIWLSLFNLLPFVEMDGTYILQDLVNSPNLRMMSMGYVLNPFRRLLKKPPYPIHPKSWAKLGYAIYGTLCLAYSGLAIAFLIYFVIFQYKMAFTTLFGIFLMLSIVLFLLKSLFLKRIQQKREFLRRKVISY